MIPKKAVGAYFGTQPHPGNGKGYGAKKESEGDHSAHGAGRQSKSLAAVGVVFWPLVRAFEYGDAHGFILPCFKNARPIFVGKAIIDVVKIECPYKISQKDDGPYNHYHKGRGLVQRPVIAFNYHKGSTYKSHCKQNDSHQIDAHKKYFAIRVLAIVEISI